MCYINVQIGLQTIKDYNKEQIKTNQNYNVHLF